MRNYLDFEKPLEELEIKIHELNQLKNNADENILAALEKFEKKSRELQIEIFHNLTPWQKCQIARHPDRPYTLDYIKIITNDFVELHGDRVFSDDPAIIGGLASIENFSLLIVGHQKGRGVKERIKRNFGQPHPEGYRKALRLMKLAEKFAIPIVTFIDTPGAFPGIGAEERGQSVAISTNLMELSLLSVPIISIVIGEGGSGGALALSVADRLFMLEHSIYSVISPEGCAAILWNKKNGLTKNDYSTASSALKLTAKDLLDFKIIDGIIEEPLGAAHRSLEETAMNIKRCIINSLKELKEISRTVLLSDRVKKIKRIGIFTEPKV